jgi:hypothetical protein
VKDRGITPLPLATSRYSARALIVASGLAPIRTSIGHPRWKLGYELAGSCKELMPLRSMLQMEQDEYRALYEARLDAVGFTRLDDLLRTLSEQAGGRGLVLLCFEDLAKPGLWCHRRMFAAWWEAKCGQAVPELAAVVPPAQGKLF